MPGPSTTRESYVAATALSAVRSCSTAAPIPPAPAVPVTSPYFLTSGPESSFYQANDDPDNPSMGVNPDTLRMDITWTSLVPNAPIGQGGHIRGGRIRGRRRDPGLTRASRWPSTAANAWRPGSGADVELYGSRCGAMLSVGHVPSSAAGERSVWY
jgi:hypothetical protein